MFGFEAVTHDVKLFLIIGSLIVIASILVYEFTGGKR